MYAARQRPLRVFSKRSGVQLQRNSEKTTNKLHHDSLGSAWHFDPLANGGKGGLVQHEIGGAGHAQTLQSGGYPESASQIRTEGAIDNYNNGRVDRQSLNSVLALENMQQHPERQADFWPGSPNKPYPGSEYEHAV